MKIPIFLQSQSAECGSACLAAIANWHGYGVDLVELRRRFPVGQKGTTLRQLMANADAMGFSSRPLRLEMSELGELKLPCIAHVNLNHFIVLHRVSKSWVRFMDPAVGERRLSMAEFSKQFTGVALELSPRSDFEKKAPPALVSLKELTGKVIGLKSALAKIFAMAFALECFAIAAPLVNQLVVDDAITSHDDDLLTLLIIGFLLLLVAQTAIGLARRWIVMVLSQSIQLQWTTNVFAHLLRLPVSFFELRQLGDVVSRFGSVGEIQRAITTSLVESILDGIMAVVALVMIFLYAPVLSYVVVGAVAAYGLLRWASYRAFRDAAAERLVVSARENTHFLETLRAIAPIKLFSRELERRSRWESLVVDVQNRDIRTAKLSIIFNTSNALLFGIENLIVLWLGARMVMNGSGSGPQFSVGMLLAFLAYKGQFTGRVSALIEYGVTLRMLSLHSERLGDIVLHPAEPVEDTVRSATHLQPSLELRNASFRYGEGEHWVLRESNLRIEPGEIVAITGASGAGKTTLLKVLLGLLEPVEGEVRYGDMPVRTLGLTSYRACVGTVLQDDALLSGSVLENITFFDSEPDSAWAEQCAKTAQLHDEIGKMPMGYHTLVGDLGTGLSGGQKQRLMLARALYKRPKVLALDEATSHLDAANERAISRELSALKITRLVIAHRAETIASATRVMKLADGKLTEALRVASPQREVRDSALDA